MLAYQWQAGSGVPVVFLHGLLGSRQDWQPVLDLLQNINEIRPLVIDLPLHHQSERIACHDFAEMRDLLDITLQHCIGSQSFYLVGYSLGGRIALDYAIHRPNTALKGVILEGANIGLATMAEREQRWLNDQKWAERFHSEPIEMVLIDWYKQSVFTDLDEHQRERLISLRRQNNGKNIAQMLLATSLAKQTYFYPFIAESDIPIRFLIGEQDHKFRQMVERYHLDYQLIECAGHNAHFSNPIAFVQCLLKMVKGE